MNGGFTPPGGGGNVSDPAVGYIRADGNDSTGDGSPGAPFLTAQAAVNAGFRNLDIGIMDAGDILVSGFDGSDHWELRLRGAGKGSVLGTIRNTSGGGLTVQEVGFRSVAIGTISNKPIIPPDDLNGVSTDYELHVIGPVDVAFVSADGGDGGTAQSSFTNGGNGGAVYLEGPVKVRYLVSSAGGNPGTDNGAGVGSVGNPGTITLRNWPDLATMNPNSATVIGGALIADATITTSF